MEIVLDMGWDVSTYPHHLVDTLILRHPSLEALKLTGWKSNVSIVPATNDLCAALRVDNRYLLKLRHPTIPKNSVPAKSVIDCLEGLGGITLHYGGY